MLTEEDDKTVYMGAYEQKQRIIELMKKGKINADIYLKTLQKAVKANAYEDIQITIQMQLQDWDTIHNKDTMEWFMDIVNESGAEYETVQTPKYKALKSGKPIPKDDDDIDIDDVDDIDIDDNDDDIINQVDQITGEK